MTQYLYDALNALQSTESVQLWADQICINQKDKQDKSNQLPKMAEIYTQAQKVVVWLGKAADGSEIAMDFFTRLAAQGDNISPHLMAHLGYRTVMSIQLHDFFSRPWFSRVWTLQEAAVATDCVVQCGSQQIHWTAFERFNRNCQRDLTGQWSNVLSNIATARDASSECIQRFITSHINEIGELKAANQASAPVQSLTMALERHRNCGCTVDLDRIYAILVFLPRKVKDAIVSTYGSQTRAQLYADVAHAELASLDWPEHFGAAGRARQKRDFRTTAPSWVPDWTYPQRHHTFWALDRDCRTKTLGFLYQATDDDPSAFFPIRLSDRHIRVRGKILDTIAEQASPFLFFSSVLVQKSARISELRAKTPIKTEDWKELHELLASVKADMEALEQDRSKQLTDCLTLALNHCGESTYPSGSSQDTRTAVFHTLFGGAKPSSARPGVSTLSTGGVLVRASDDEVRRGFTDPQVVPMRLDLLQNACKSRVFFVTECNYLGLAPGFLAMEEEGPKEGQSEEEQVPEHSRGTEGKGVPRECATRMGDRVCVVRGCVTPFVIRPVASKLEGQMCWELVGECYVHGLMDGEAVGEKWDHVGEEDILFA